MTDVFLQISWNMFIYHPSSHPSPRPHPKNSGIAFQLWPPSQKCDVELFLKICSSFYFFSHQDRRPCTSGLVFSPSKPRGWCCGNGFSSWGWCGMPGRGWGLLPAAVFSSFPGCSLMADPTLLEGGQVRGNDFEIVYVVAYLSQFDHSRLLVSSKDSWIWVTTKRQA